MGVGGNRKKLLLVKRIGIMSFFKVNPQHSQTELNLFLYCTQSDVLLILPLGFLAKLNESFVAGNQ